MEEIWKDIKDYPLYQVSNLGNVRSRNYQYFGGKYRNILYKKKGRMLKQFVDNGYAHVNLSRNGKIKKSRVHRLVATAFLPNPTNLPMVNHKDENKLNNNVDNLEWCTPLYNTRYGTGILRAKINNSYPVLQFTLDGEFVKEWFGANEAARNIGVSPACISMAARGILKTSQKFKWKYKKDYHGSLRFKQP